MNLLPQMKMNALFKGLAFFHLQFFFHLIAAKVVLDRDSSFPRFVLKAKKTEKEFPFCNKNYNFIHRFKMYFYLQHRRGSTNVENG